MIEERNKLIKNLYQNSQLRLDLIAKQETLVIFIDYLNKYIGSLRFSFDQLSNKSERIWEKTNEEINELNNLKKDLQKIYGELEELKNDIISFQHFEGKFKNLLCENLKREERVECNVIEEIIKKD